MRAKNLVLIPGIALQLALAGCAAAVVGAGAAAGIAYTNRGVASDVKGPVARVDQDALSVFREMKITKTESSVEDSGAKRTLQGRSVKNDVNVTVEMKRSPNETTHVEVYAKSGSLSWNKDYAKEVLQKIVQKT